MATATARLPAKGLGRPLRRAAIATAAALFGLAVAYPTVIAPWQRHLGATPEEIARSMPGDGLVAHPLEVTTRAVTVNTGPEHVWPWLVQMGNNRGGLYSYDWIDLLIGALERRSVDQVLPEFQNPQVGDTLPYARGSDFIIRSIERERSLVFQLQLDDVDVVQSWGLYPIDASHTRLVLRVQAAMPVSFKMLPVLMLLDPSEGFMVHRQLLGIKQRAESLATRA